MVNQFDVVRNIPYFIFGVAFFVAFVLFVWAGILLLMGNKDAQKKEKGRQLLLIAISTFGIIILTVLVFWSVTFLLRSWEETKARQVSGEFPLSPIQLDQFPLGPQFIAIGEREFKNGLGKYYFNGPWSLASHRVVAQPAIYAILCKDGDAYNVVALGQTPGKIAIGSNEELQCWIQNCKGDAKGLSIGLFWTPADKYQQNDLFDITTSLTTQTKPACASVQK